MRKDVMTAEERRKLIEAPICIRTIGGRRWAGHSTMNPFVHGRGRPTDDDPSVRYEQQQDE